MLVEPYSSPWPSTCPNPYPSPFPYTREVWGFGFKLCCPKSMIFKTGYNKSQLCTYPGNDCWKNQTHLHNHLHVQTRIHLHFHKQEKVGVFALSYAVLKQWYLKQVIISHNFVHTLVMIVGRTILISITIYMSKPISVSISI